MSEVEVRDIEELDDSDHISAAESAINIYCSLCANDENIDKGLMTKTDQARIATMKRMCIRIAHEHIKQKYAELFGEDDEE